MKTFLVSSFLFFAAGLLFAILIQDEDCTTEVGRTTLSHRDPVSERGMWVE